MRKLEYIKIYDGERGRGWLMFENKSRIGINEWLSILKEQFVLESSEEIEFIELEGWVYPNELPFGYK